ncbi:BLIP family protein [Streptomyces sp. HD]|uniref:BLIP family protein n=1 Tax=Streptomyces sp. HD TaxID=3020892 RepID=UPI00232DC7F1|nr:BLIP family protein [Streptomyces sp. HD]MDC0772468.1 BLIP family protein [Streptomyces sp. HD]
MLSIRSAAAAMAAATMAAVGTAGSAGATEPWFTVEQYDSIHFGMTKTEVLAITGDSPGCTVSATSMSCRAESADYPPYGGFNFTTDGKVYRKFQEQLHVAKKPSITTAQYNRTHLGMTEAQLWGVVSPDSCAVGDESYPNWPATNGHKVLHYCTATTGLFAPSARFQFTDGTLTWSKSDL